MFSIPIFFPSIRLNRSLICCSFGVSLSYCFATEGSVFEFTSLDLRGSGILRVVLAEKCRGLLKELNGVLKYVVLDNV